MKTEYIVNLTKAKTKQLIKQAVKAEKAGHPCELDYLLSQINLKILKDKNK